jgi:hypothetical protein
MLSPATIALHDGLAEISSPGRRGCGVIATITRDYSYLKPLVSAIAAALSRFIDSMTGYPYRAGGDGIDQAKSDVSTTRA